jgi:uncharacterized membrane protein YfcA
VDFWAYSLAGLVVGVIVGLTGVGGGSLMTPLLVLFGGVPPVTAVGTDLLHAALSKVGGVWVYARRGSVDWRLVGRLAAGSLPACLICLALIHYAVRDARVVSSAISHFLGFALILTALATVFRESIWRWARGRRPENARPPHFGWFAITGAAIGTLVTVSSVGAGAIGVTALMLLVPALRTTAIVGSDLAHAVPLTLVAGLGHASAGAVDWTLLGSLLAGSLPGVWLGSQLSHRIPDRALRIVLGGILVLVGGKLAV